MAEFDILPLLLRRPSAKLITRVCILIIIVGRIVLVVISCAPLQRLNLMFIFLILIDKLLHAIGG